MSYNQYNKSNNAYQYDYAPAYEEPISVPVRVKKSYQAVIDNRRREGRMNVLVAFKIALEAILVVAACCVMVYFYTEVNMLKRDITKKEAEYNELVRENQDFKNELTKNIDISQIKGKAKKLGMKNVKRNKIRYYETCCEEYVLQMEEFPVE